MKIVLFEILAVASLVAFAVVVWWPAALLVLGVSFGAIAWNLHREERR